MQSVLRHFYTVNSAAKISAVILEQERTNVLIPPVFDIILEILISFPWQRNTNQQTNNALLELAN